MKCEDEVTYLLFVRNGVQQLGISTKELFAEQEQLEYDKKALMRGKSLILLGF